MGLTTIDRDLSIKFTRFDGLAEVSGAQRCVNDGSVNGYEFGQHLCPGIAEGRTAGQEDLVELFPQLAHLLRGEDARPLALLGELASKLTRLHSALHTIHINPYADHYKN